MEPAKPTDDAEAAFLDLHAQREDLERLLSLARMQQRFGTARDAVEQANTDEKSLLLSLDRIMTQIRAAEYKRRPNSRRW